MIICDKKLTALSQSEPILKLGIKKNTCAICVN